MADVKIVASSKLADLRTAEKAAAAALEAAIVAENEPVEEPVVEAPVVEAAPSEEDAAAAKAAAQEKAAKDGTTADPSGLPAALVYPDRIASAMFTLRNHGYLEIETLIGDLYAGVVRLEGTIAGG